MVWILWLSLKCRENNNLPNSSPLLPLCFLIKVDEAFLVVLFAMGGASSFVVNYIGVIKDAHERNISLASITVYLLKCKLFLHMITNNFSKLPISAKFHVMVY